MLHIQKGIGLKGIAFKGFACKNVLPTNVSVKKGMYHRERILETSTLSCNEEEEEITKPPTR